MSSVKEKKKIFCFVNLLKAFAAILIINSHYDTIYPISALATGGAIGNALFFAISGFCLYPITIKFKKWFFNKIIKIYIPTLLMSTIALFTYLKDEYSIGSMLFIIIWPTIFWFVGAIILFYALYYILRNVRTNRNFIFIGMGLMLIYFIYYIFLLDTSSWVIESKGLNSISGYFKLIYYFAAMMMGKWFRINCNNIHKNKLFGTTGMILSFMSIYAFKFFIANNTQYMYLQFLNQFSVILFVYFTFSLFAELEKNIKFYRNTRIYKTISFVSDLTLYLYLVQFFVISSVEKYMFPFNFIFATILIFLLAILLHYISEFVYKNLIIFSLQIKSQG